MSETHRLTSTVQSLIGDSDDSHNIETIFGKLNQILEHLHKPGLIYPSLADSIDIVSGNGTWLLGDAVTIIPADTITFDFDIHRIFVSDMQFQDDEYQVNLYRLDNDELVGQAKMKTTSQISTPNPTYIMTPLIPANTGIYAKAATSDSGDGIISISLNYHIY